MDLNHDGRISVLELTKAARLIGLNPTRDEAEQMIQDCKPSRIFILLTSSYVFYLYTYTI